MRFVSVLAAAIALTAGVETGEDIHLPEGVESRLSWDKETLLDDIRVSLAACAALSLGMRRRRSRAAAHAARSVDFNDSMSSQGRI
jgi:hypothetical protein